LLGPHATALSLSRARRSPRDASASSSRAGERGRDGRIWATDPAGGGAVPPLPRRRSSAGDGRASGRGGKGKPELLPGREVAGRGTQKEKGAGAGRASDLDGGAAARELSDTAGTLGKSVYETHNIVYERAMAVYETDSIGYETVLTVYETDRTV
jgi:hypothetical protein